MVDVQKIFYAKLLLCDLGLSCMIEYIVYIHSSLKVDNDEIAQEELVPIPIARYNYDLGLQLHEKIVLRDISLGYEIFPLITGAVVDVLKVIKQKRGKDSPKDNDIYMIEVIIELDDKEDMPKIRDIIKELNPGKYKD
jgi:hypothetical protein